ncbi:MULTISPECIES: VOC family protein [unclassified Clostridium]|uniref:SMU1112c/YaeR family gloxylase I-like metalloprotein n=1 Tax=unclassified Clostridium TaxID=2614128 RepID=UPI000297EF35|nr:MULTISPECIES: VOC family protein [unclassified Clostridium]EKQ56695.1 MAG: lactoylglutathione lyase-like lyase [Clostridium sp. Maddingley MBC34-26]
MNLNLIHHIAIIASNYEVSKNFYVNILGLKIIRENYRIDRDSYKLDLKIGNSEIELFSMPNAPERPSYPEACGLRHLAFCVDNIEEVVAELNANGINTEPIRIDEYTGKKFTFFSDPDGLPLELHE